MLIFPCHVCRTSLSADEAQSGQLVRCPTCLTTLRVPAAQREAVPVGAAGDAPPERMENQRFTPPPPAPGSRGGVSVPGTLGNFRVGGKRFGFNCGRS